MAVELTSDQLAAVDKLRTGSILCGGVGSGKTRTALTYYYTKVCGGELKINGSGKTTIPKKKIPLYVITTGKTRDEENWQKESLIFYDVNPIVDSWNNIKKYRDVKHAFFVFDEQRVVGYGEWSKTFIHIARNNDWILLSATPGDTWIEYAPVMIANGYYKNLSDFRYQHVVYSRYTKYPKIERYVNTGKLERLRSKIVIKMDDRRITIPHDIYIKVDYNKELFEQIDTTLFDSINNKPIRNASELCSILRRIVNSDHSRIDKVVEILSFHPKVIIFYNFNYELEMLIDLMESIHYSYSQWNGHKHEPIPSTDQWAYLVQYSAGAEGWNCIETDTILYFSQNYSYKIMEQASGRINRMNTPFIDLYYYHLISDSRIDIAIRKALKSKKRFNERAFCGLSF